MLLQNVHHEKWNRFRHFWCYHQKPRSLVVFIGKMYFFTAAILNWHAILNERLSSNIIMDSLRYLVQKQEIDFYAYVIMPNHIHLIWKPNAKNVQLKFMKFTGQQLKFYLAKEHPEKLFLFKSDSADREYQLWQKRPMAIELYSRKVTEQKLDYIHANPVQGKWMLADSPLDYPFSSARYYELGEPNSLLTHYMDYLG